MACHAARCRAVDRYALVLCRAAQKAEGLSLPRAARFIEKAERWATAFYLVPRHVPAADYASVLKPLLIAGIDVHPEKQTSEELMRLAACTAVTATVLAFTFSQAPRVLALDSDLGASSRPFQLEGGSSPASDNQGQSAGRQSEGTERSGAAGSQKIQTQVEGSGMTAVRGHRHAKVGYHHRIRHHVAFHRRGRGWFTFNHRRRHWVIHRRGHRLVAVSGSNSG